MRRARLLAAALLLAGALLAEASGTAQAAAPQFGINVEPSYRPWRWAGGPNPDSWWDVAAGQARVDTEMALAARLGAAQVRVEFPWTFIEPARGSFDWARADAIVAAGNQRGVSVEPILVFCPAWEGAPNCVPKSADYAAFVTAFASRYRGQIHVYDLWNEPNCCAGRYFAGSVAQYVSGVLNPGYAAVKAVDGSAQVLTETSGVQSDWMSGLRAAGAKLDIFAYHDYSSVSQVNGDSHYVRELMNSNGYGSLPLWLDEFGVQEPGVSDGNQQSWLRAVLAPGANAAVNIKWYNLRDDNIYTSSTAVAFGNTYGLAQHDLVLKQGACVYATMAGASGPCVAGQVMALATPTPAALPSHPATAEAPAPAATAAAARRPPSSSPPLLWIALLVAGLAIVGGSVALFVRRRR